MSVDAESTLEAPERANACDGAHPLPIAERTRKNASSWLKSYPEKRRRILEQVLMHCSGKLRHFLQAYEGKSRKAAIAAKCLDCCCYEQEEVRRCSVNSCPLHSYRPYKVKEEGAEA